MKRALVVLAFLSAAAPCSALQLRSYNATIHDRFTGFPGEPVMNPDFLYGASRFTGVGWCNQAAHLEFTLVTPQHFLCANHTGAKPSLGNTVRFVGKDGSVSDRTVTVLTNITNDTGDDSDLVVGTLDAPLPDTVVPLPWLNLNNGSENSYRNLSLMVLGWYAKGGAGTLSNFQTVSDGASIASTRMCYFVYNTTSGGANDCYFEGGDSGSPTFGTATNGEPALIGTHSTVGTTSTGTANFDTFLPHYVTKVDTVLSASGYRVRPANATATTVALTSASSPSTLTQAAAGSVTFTVANTGSAATGNAALTLSFPAGTAPDSITMPGWVVESTGSGTWSLRKATLAAAESGVATAAWAALPGVASIAITTTLRSDVTAAVTGQTTLTPGSAYAAWAHGLEAGGQVDDPDGDGVPNLLEYAFGGDPGEAALTVAGSTQPLLPQVSFTDAMVTVTYPERTDATTRNLSYAIETSADLIEWTTTLPESHTSNVLALDPAVPGIALRQVTWPASEAALFVRVSVGLNEPQ